ncbi:MAG: MFS transporter, partial [Alphaproteobacteria bacterium]
LTASAPFLNPRLLLDRNFAIGTAIAFVMGMLAFTSLTLFPTMLHDLRGYPDNAVSILIAARGMGNWVAFLVVVQLTRWAPRFTIGLGMFFQALSGFWMAQFDINVTEAQIFWSHLLQGFGQSIAFTPMTVMAFSTLPAHQVTEGSAIFTLMRNFGSSLFISIAVMMLIRSSGENYARLGEFVTPYNKLLTLPNFPASWDLESASGLFRLAGEIQRQAAMIGYVNAFYLMAATAAISVPLAFFMQRRSGWGRAWVAAQPICGCTAQRGFVSFVQHAKSMHAATLHFRQRKNSVEGCATSPTASAARGVSEAAPCVTWTFCSRRKSSASVCFTAKFTFCGISPVCPVAPSTAIPARHVRRRGRDGR